MIRRTVTVENQAAAVAREPIAGWLKLHLMAHTAVCKNCVRSACRGLDVAACVEVALGLSYDVLKVELKLGCCMHRLK